jgi:hypothetical protein
MKSSDIIMQIIEMDEGQEFMLMIQEKFHKRNLICNFHIESF